MTLNAKLLVNVTANLTNALDLGSEAAAPLSKSYLTTLLSGIAAGQADMLYFDNDSTATNKDVDLAGVLAGPLGGVLTFARIKGLIVATPASNPGNVVVGNAAANAWSTLLGATGTVTLRPGAVFAAFAGQADATGYAVTGGSGDQLRLTSSAGTNFWDLVIVGASA